MWKLYVEEFSLNGNGETRKKANYLYPATRNSSFILNVILISKYPSVLEPVVQLFQTPRIDLSEVWKHIELLVSIFTEHRQNSEGEFSIIWDEALKTAALLNVELSFPQIVGRQLYRSNIPNPEITNAEEYYRTPVFIPYLDDPSSLKDRFL